MTGKDWLVISVRIPSLERAGEVSEALIALGGTAVEESGGVLTTYVPAPRQPAAFIRQANDRLRTLLPGHDLDLVWRSEHDQDWAKKWKEGLRPRRVGDRLVISPLAELPEDPTDDLVVLIEPAMAFGTGEHATTRASLRFLETAIRPGDRVLDVGAGSGVLAIAAVRLGAGEVLAVDIEPEAVENAQTNVARNHVADRVQVVHGVVDDAFLEVLGPGSNDVIVGNILASVLEPLLPALSTMLLPGGRLILAGILEEEAEGVIAAAQAVGFALDVEDLEEEWWAGLFTKQ